MTCKNCNAPLEERARFCVNCGARVSEPQQDQATTIAQQGQQGDIGKVPQPRKVDIPIRPPKRPTPTARKQEIDVDIWNNVNEQSIPATGLDAGHTPPPEANNAAYEQPTIIVTPDNPQKHADTTTRGNSFYKQPTTIVGRNDSDKEKAEPEIAILVTPDNVPTLPFEMPSIPHPELVEPGETKDVEAREVDELSPLEISQPLLYYKLNTSMKGSQKLPGVVNRAAYNRRRQGRAGCFLGCLTTLVILLLILGAAWIFALRPYAHDIAQRQLDTALTSAVNQIPSQTRLLPAGSTIPVNENSINNLVVLNLAPSSPVQHPTTSISTKNIRLGFQLYSLPCAITMVPILTNGRLAASQVGVEGVFSAIMSPEEMTALLNQHFNDAQFKLQRTISSVQLKDQEMDLTLS
ncbi:MAG: hypothetical protein PVS3B1_22350 [Ktedonobacteraceae bacterium]